jgi:hypothetical protein
LPLGKVTAEVALAAFLSAATEDECSARRRSAPGSLTLKEMPRNDISLVVIAFLVLNYLVYRELVWKGDDY